MKQFIIILIFVIAVVLSIKLIRSPEPVTPSKTFTLESNWESERLAEKPDPKRYDLREQTRPRQNGFVGLATESSGRAYGGNDETKSEINNQKLLAYAKAFVEVQSYMNRTGSKTDYNETRKIVKRHGLSVEDYTRIATQMNKNPKLRETVQKLINKVKPSIQ
jgi:hypothetical protein